MKELQNANLYYNLGMYLGNNYQSAVIVAQNALKLFPYSKYKEDFEMLILKSKYQMARQSVEEKRRNVFAMLSTSITRSSTTTPTVLIAKRPITSTR